MAVRVTVFRGRAGGIWSFLHQGGVRRRRCGQRRKRNSGLVINHNIFKPFFYHSDPHNVPYLGVCVLLECLVPFLKARLALPAGGGRCWLRGSLLALGALSPSLLGGDLGSHGRLWWVRLVRKSNSEHSDRRANSGLIPDVPECLVPTPYGVLMSGCLKWIRFPKGQPDKSYLLLPVLSVRPAGDPLLAWSACIRATCR